MRTGTIATKEPKALHLYRVPVTSLVIILDRSPRPGRNISPPNTPAPPPVVTPPENPKAEPAQAPTLLSRFKPLLGQVTLTVGDLNLRPTRPPHLWRQEYEAGHCRIIIDKSEISAIGTTEDQQKWSNKSPDGFPLRWLTHNQKIGFLQTFELDKQGSFGSLRNPALIRRIDLDSGQWLEDLRVDLNPETKVVEVQSAKAGQGDLAILATSSDAYHVVCFRGQNRVPHWKRTFKTHGTRGYGGVYVWGITPPEYPHSQLQHLTWLDDKLIVLAEALQPIIALERESGVQLWEIDKIWEFERGFIGPSVYQHYISRFGIEDHLRSFAPGSEKWEHANSKFDETERKKFNEIFSCALIGGPILAPRRDTRVSSMFVAVAKGPTRGWSNYLSDCVIYEFDPELGVVLATAKLPQLVRGERFAVTANGIVWAGQNDSLMKLTAIERNYYGVIGRSGRDLISRLAWFQQASYETPDAWLTAGRATNKVAFGKTFAIYAPAGGFVTSKGDRTYKFPLILADLSTGMQRQCLLSVPFNEAIREPKDETVERIRMWEPYLMGITDIRARGETVELTPGMENWSATLTFDLNQVPHGPHQVKSDSEDNDYSSRIAAFIESKSLSQELITAAGQNDAKYVRALLKAGADPNAQSQQDYAALIEASVDGSAETVDLLINAGSDVQARDSRTGRTALMWAAGSRFHSARKIKSMLTAGAQIDAINPRSGRTALMIAAREGNVAGVSVLLANGANPGGRDKDGHSLIQQVKESGMRSKAMIELLAKFGITE